MDRITDKRQLEIILQRLHNHMRSTTQEGRAMPVPYLTLTQAEVGWLLAEIEGGRDAFAAIVQQNQQLRQKVASQEQSLQDLHHGLYALKIELQKR